MTFWFMCVILVQYTEVGKGDGKKTHVSRSNPKYKVGILAAEPQNMQ